MQVRPFGVVLVAVKFIFYLPLLLGGIYLLATLSLFLFQSRFLFYPSHLADDYRFKFDVPFEEKYFLYGKNERVHGLLFKPAHATCRILYFHGNGGAVDSWGYNGASLAEKLKCEVLMMDYPGYGKSSGDLASDEQILFESATAAMTGFQDETDQKLPLIVYGRSLGTAIASYLATKYPVKGLVLESPYTSLKAFRAALVPWFPSFLIRYNLDNVENLKQVRAPTLIIHGTADAMIPYALGKSLFESHPASQLVTIEGGGHDDLALFADYWQALEKLTTDLQTEGRR